MGHWERHSTGITIALFIGGALVLSALPLPEWLRPLELVQDEHPIDVFIARILARPESMPRTAQGYGEHGAAVIEDDVPSDTEASEHAVELEPTKTTQRDTWKKPARPHYESYVATLGIASAPLVNPSALDRFFTRLAAAEDQKPGSRVRVVHYGDSLIASDKITDLVRLRLQERFGSGGKGFLLVKKFNQFQRGHRTGQGTGGWVLDVITQGKLRDNFFGYSGASFTAQKAGEETVFEHIGINTVAQVFYLAQQGGGVLELVADGKVLETIDTDNPAGAKEARIAEVKVPEDTKKLVLRAKTQGARVFGVVLEADVPGLIYESVGLPGATSEVWLLPEPSDFARQLSARDPGLVVIMLGGNDGLMLSKGRTTIAAIEKAQRDLIARIKAAAPESDCLLVSPLEAVRAKADGRMVPKPEVPQIAAMQERLANELGCGYWDMYASMGGEGSLKKWINAGLMLGDLIHPKNKGSDLLGEMMVESLMNAYDARRSQL